MDLYNIRFLYSLSFSFSLAVILVSAGFIKEYIRSFDTQSIGFQHTGRICSERDCEGKLKDLCLDWDDVLPEKDFRIAERHCEKADLVKNNITFK